MTLTSFIIHVFKTLLSNHCLPSSLDKCIVHYVIDNPLWLYSIMPINSLTLCAGVKRAVLCVSVCNSLCKLPLSWKPVYVDGQLAQVNSFQPPMFSWPSLLLLSGWLVFQCVFKLSDKLCTSLCIFFKITSYIFLTFMEVASGLLCIDFLCNCMAFKL